MYHIQQSYAANGALSWLLGYTVSGTGVNTPFTDWLIFNQDGEGRPLGSWDATKSNYVYWAGTDYNPASQPTWVGLQGGAESFSYDPNSGRVTQWQSTAGSKTQTGSLTWNANGTLQQLGIAGCPTQAGFAWVGIFLPTSQTDLAPAV